MSSAAQPSPTSFTKLGAGRYESGYAFVWQYGSGVMDLLAPQPGERILDLGCGPGQLTAKIAESGATVVGMDPDAGMIAQARQNFPALEFVQADARDFSFDRPFDAIFSNAALHWVKPPEKAVACMARALRPGGRLVLEMGGEGNIQIFVEAVEQALAELGDTDAPSRKPWYFPSQAEYAGLLEAHGLEVTSAALFDRPTRVEGERGLEDWLRVFGRWALAVLPEAQWPMLFNRVEDLARPALWRDDAWQLDYRRLRLVAVRKADQS